jgi:Tfp pilus assembly pilus retraction ATPase PilT
MTARLSFAALAAKLRPALVGLGSFRDAQSSAIVLDSAETGRLVRALCRRQTAAQHETAGPAR